MSRARIPASRAGLLESQSGHFGRDMVRASEQLGAELRSESCHCSVDIGWQLFHFMVGRGPPFRFCPRSGYASGREVFLFV